jgi:hypothetical protein
MPSILRVTISSIVAGFCPDPVLFDTSRKHYSRERRQAGHKSYEGNNTGKQQQNMTLESSTNDFREKDENQTYHTGVVLFSSQRCFR